MSRVALDIDGVLADFNSGVLDAGRRMGVATGLPRTPAEITEWEIGPAFPIVWEAVSGQEAFWRTLNPYPNVVKDAHILRPVAYVTHRPIDVTVTKAWLDDHGFPEAPVFNVGSGQSKVPSLALIEANLFIDDKVDNVEDVLKDMACYLMDRPYNRDATHLDPYRITSLLEAA